MFLACHSNTSSVHSMWAHLWPIAPLWTNEINNRRKNGKRGTKTSKIKKRRPPSLALSFFCSLTLFLLSIIFCLSFYLLSFSLFLSLVHTLLDLSYSTKLGLAGLVLLYLVCIVCSICQAAGVSLCFSFLYCQCSRFLSLFFFVSILYFACFCLLFYPGKTRQDKLKQNNRTKQDNVGQDKNKIRQDTRQDKTRQDDTTRHD